MKQYLLFAVLPPIVLTMAFLKKEHVHPDKHLEIVLRNIGHEVLLHSQDSTSRVLPDQVKFLGAEKKRIKSNSWGPKKNCFFAI